MRAFLLSVITVMVFLLPNVSTAQTSPWSTAPPQVTAATSDWQIDSVPIVINSWVYLPTREMRFFDGQVMVQVGVYEGVPVYADATLEPNSLVYVPVGSNRMRMYERRRNRELAGTTGSRTPSFPVEAPGAASAGERIAGTTGVLITSATDDTHVAPTRPQPTSVETIPPPHDSDGVWLEFRGARWYSGGAATPYVPDRFTKVGDYHGFPVYRDTTDTTNRIWVPAVIGGPLAPYARH